jgi:hypothetical protein
MAVSAKDRALPLEERYVWPPPLPRGKGGRGHRVREGRDATMVTGGPLIRLLNPTIFHTHVRAGWGVREGQARTYLTSRKPVVYYVGVRVVCTRG